LCGSVRPHTDQALTAVLCLSRAKPFPYHILGSDHTYSQIPRSVGSQMFGSQDSVCSSATCTLTDDMYLHTYDVCMCIYISWPRIFLSHFPFPLLVLLSARRSIRSITLLQCSVFSRWMHSSVISHTIVLHQRQELWLTKSFLPLCKRCVVQCANNFYNSQQFEAQGTHSEWPHLIVGHMHCVVCTPSPQGLSSMGLGFMNQRNVGVLCLRRGNGICI